MRGWPRASIRDQLRAGGDPPCQLTCRELVELITDHLEGSLPPTMVERFEVHLLRCRGCTAHLARIRRTLQTLGAIPTERLSPRARTSLLDAFWAWRKRG